ncbi:MULTISPECIES: tRNA (adenosine(37)-N6)-threonylcarbamoyltransferase complex ATPase subunit type 1 TsaE [unclassified Aureispira]|uniref:tRNA (adenosine(37)-N6)-threonylcarbamoyltransferase complex ATPase subunit type 1 TsaE n=1 Tax=unclassified Aureispira TaxID=2649989 RepID=UPI0006962F8A|nr:MULTISPECIES: tRNA (adenosine(37)-N6)-threonylcarbamoyltransferase complex ATPase subunit type 1 TsaE [unclassified Aureispira]WMX16150.1 tRNA (adenosine(37)-N6)-threonylcarbamoyltransferase complex ATPase subunit type 1 TsaE [Aureispira sp. CCB-E]
MRQQFVANSIDQLDAIVKALTPIIKTRKKVAFLGQIGAGKTTFIKQLCRNLGVKDLTSSPTFSIINQYEAPQATIYHVDLYRLKSEEEAFSIGLMELLDDNSYCFIEWPSIIENYFPESALWIKISVDESENRIFDIYYE